MRERRIITVLVIVLTVLYLAVRLTELDRLVTTDEPLWLGRSANFYRALVSGELEYTYQKAHPGGLTMWAGAFAYLLRAPDFGQLSEGNLEDVRSIATVLRSYGYDPLEIMVAAKVSKVLLQGVFFAVSIVYVKKNFGTLAMILAGLLIAWNPFLAGHDALLHIDGLFAITALAAGLSLGNAIAIGSSSMWPWVTAGALAACMWMTRSTGAVLVVIPLALALWAYVHMTLWREPWHRDAWRPLAAVIVWFGAAGLVSFVLLPALWTEPFGTMLRLVVYTVVSGAEGHENPVYFNGEIVYGDPGLLFYPITLLWRSTPVAFVGVIVLAILLVMNRRTRWFSARQAVTIATLLLFAAMFVTGMTLSAKKFDRYILMVYPIMDVLTAAGLSVVLTRAATYLPRLRVPVGIAVTALVAMQAVLLLSVFPYRLDYFNPLLGGMTRVEQFVQLGWGQGGDQAIAFIERDADGRNVIVYTADMPSSYEYFSPQTVQVRRLKRGADVPCDADYVISSIQQSQRGIDAVIPEKLSPKFEIGMGSVRFIQVYEVASDCAE